MLTFHYILERYWKKNKRDHVSQLLLTIPRKYKLQNLLCHLTMKSRWKGWQASSESVIDAAFIRGRRLYHFITLFIRRLFEGGVKKRKYAIVIPRNVFILDVLLMNIYHVLWELFSAVYCFICISIETLRSLFNQLDMHDFGRRYQLNILWMSTVLLCLFWNLYVCLNSTPLSFIDSILIFLFIDRFSFIHFAYMVS